MSAANEALGPLEAEARPIDPVLDAARAWLLARDDAEADAQAEAAALDAVRAALDVERRAHDAARADDALGDALADALALPPEAQGQAVRAALDAAQGEASFTAQEAIDAFMAAPPTAALSWPRADGREHGRIAALREPALLAGEGMAGKSWLTLDLALDAATAHAQGVPWRDSVAGLRVAAGPVVLCAGEVTQSTWGERLAALADLAHGGGKYWFVEHPSGGGARRPEPIPPLDADEAEAVTAALRDHVTLTRLVSPLFNADSPRDMPDTSAAWSRLWRTVEEQDARMVVIDPVALALLGGLNDAAFTRAFIARVEAECDRLDCWALLCAHPSKAARGAARGGADLEGAEAAGGSTQWSDGVRGALLVEPPPDPIQPKADGLPKGASEAQKAAHAAATAAKAEDWRERKRLWRHGQRRLRVVKANAGEAGREAVLTKRWAQSGRFAGWGEAPPPRAQS